MSRFDDAEQTAAVTHHLRRRDGNFRKCQAAALTLFEPAARAKGHGDSPTAKGIDRLVEGS